MGVDVLVCGATDDEHAAIHRLFDERDRVFSRFRPESELSRVNRDSSEVLVVSRLFADALRTALRAAAATDGLVDPTLGAAIEAAGYDRDFSLLSDDERPLGPAVPGRRWTVRLSGRLLSRPPGTALDLNGVVKALAVDAALELIDGDGLVAAGGDVAARGGALVGLPGGGALRLLAGGMATSGTTKRRWLRGGTLQHHLIDTHSGRPAVSCWDEVTVAAGSCVGADVAAKAAFLLSENGPDWLDERGLPGRFLARGEVTVNRAWRELLHEHERAAA
ncbi:MAG TPA: FAD:protein FMN transferase [Gaiellaceae bacterium]|nr:FAD:protein FMN transferase [Gaiellaceae bacterium]